MLPQSWLLECGNLESHASYGVGTGACHQEVNTSMPHRNLQWRLHSEANGHPRKENGFDDCMGFHIIIEYSLPPAQQPQRPVSSAMDGGARPPTRAPATSEPIDAETLARAIALVQEQRRAERQPLLS